jgi:predicted transcriptional regulator
MVQNRLNVGGVIEASFLGTLRTDPERAAPWRDFARADAIWVYEGSVPINMHLLDDVVLIWLGEHDEADLEVYGLLESGNPSVLSWAESLYEEYRVGSDLLDVTNLSKSD